MSVVFAQAKDMGQDHVFYFFQLLWALNCLDRFLEIFGLNIRHIVNDCALIVRHEVDSILQVLIFNHQLKVGIHRVVMLLRDIQEILSQLHITYQNFFDNADASDESVLGVGHAVVVSQDGHRHAEFASHLILHCTELGLGHAEVDLALLAPRVNVALMCHYGLLIWTVLQ